MQAKRVAAVRARVLRLNSKVNVVRSCLYYVLINDRPAKAKRIYIELQ